MHETPGKSFNDTKVSVVIPTYNGSHKILGLLNALKVQSVPNFEIIIVIDGSTDNTGGLLENYQYEFPYLKIFYQENRGRASSRNRGAREASGNLLIFFDDDMLPEPDCVNQHVQHHFYNPDCILTGGLENSSGGDNTDFNQFKIFLSRKWAKPLIEKHKNLLTDQDIFITAANFSISTKLFFNLEGFDEQLSDAEDFDLAVRANNAGIKLYYNHQAFAWHHDLITGVSYIRRLREYRKAHLLLHSLKPNLFIKFPMHQPVQPRGLKKIGFLFFANRFWVSWLDGRKVKYLMPQFLRYKLYDWITTANGAFFPEKIKL